MTNIPVSQSCQIPGLNEIYEKYFPGLIHGVFVEVGANDGYSWSNTWGLAEIGWRGVYFEPVKSLADKCAERHAKNNVTVVQCAVGSFNGETKMYLGESVTTSDYVAINNTFGYGNSPDKFVMSPVCALHTALSDLGIARDFELLVIDVDGDEIGVLRGLKLGNWLPRMIIIETCKTTNNKGWDFNCRGIEARLAMYYTEIYHDHINSIFVVKGDGMLSLFESKWRTILEFAGLYGCKNFVETGTGHGDTLDAVYPYFEKCCSIELGNDLYRYAKQQFANAPTVAIYHGDSGEVLSRIPALTGMTLYFLDAHYSGQGTVQGSKETPILAELKSILGSGKFNGVILIDDIKDFVSNPEYPNLAKLEEFVNGLRSGLLFEVVKQGGGMIMIAPKNKKRNPENKLKPIAPRAVLAVFQQDQALSEPDKLRNFERAPILYGPYRNPGGE